MITIGKIPKRLQGKPMVKFRNIDGVNSCVIISNYGPRESNGVE